MSTQVRVDSPEDLGRLVWFVYTTFEIGATLEDSFKAPWD